MTKIKYVEISDKEFWYIRDNKATVDFYTRALKETFDRAIEALSKADYIIED